MFTRLIYLKVYKIILIDLRKYEPVSYFRLKKPLHRIAVVSPESRFGVRQDVSRFAR